MATFTQNVADRFAPGTTVAAYLASNWKQHQLPPSGAPIGSVVSSAVVASDGLLTLLGLADSTDYFLTNSSGTPGQLGYARHRSRVSAAAAQLGYVEGTAGFVTSATAAADVPGMTLTVTVGNRPLKISFWCPVMFGSAAASASVGITRNVAGVDTSLTGSTPAWTIGSQGSNALVVATDSLPAGTVVTYRVQAFRLSGTGSVTVQAFATAPMWLRVEEVLG